MSSENRKAWDHWAKEDPFWHIAHAKDEVEFVESGKAVIAKHFARFIEPLSEGSRMLDIGCGLGRLTHQASLVNSKVQCFGVDVSDEMIRQANARQPNAPNLVFLRGDGVGLGMFVDGYFDLVMSYVVFQHLPTAVFEAYIAEAARVLKANGHFVFQVQFDAAKLGQKTTLPESDFRTIRYYSDAELTEMVSPHLNVVKVASTKGKDRAHDVMVVARK
jgi:ubiquinone/menaquinone biosynthesis C-methylase UbiE